MNKVIWLLGRRTMYDLWDVDVEVSKLILMILIFRSF